MTTKTTNMTTTDGLTVYDLNVHGSELIAVAGPAGYDPATIDTDELPEGFRWVDVDEWSEIVEAAGMEIIGTIRRNGGEITDRVTLFAGQDGRVWAAANDEDTYVTDVFVGQETTAWGGDEWDFLPASQMRCYACGEAVEPEDDDAGCGCHCPLCDATL